ncbi:Mite allergen Der p 3 [Gracilariopsis chorda]|uniref:Mite allergen Der p 3 n=1 Tax=Gracilariopsis chorda TaxID=448386 RepID=A0A2V3IUR0_9FLOR|nr:Mite allergen Der p 3 [Gracilariopsis chorda]|eukprot:PXF45845.1 Mite allergen Der p 3 [Gracilariopsis chorda]
MFNVIPSCVESGINVVEPVVQLECPCFVSFGLSSEKLSNTAVDFLVMRTKEYDKWRSSTQEGEPAHLEAFSAVGKRAKDYNMAYDTFSFQSGNMELYQNESFVLAIRTRRTDDMDCELKIMHIFQSIPRACPERLRLKVRKDSKHEMVPVNATKSTARGTLKGGEEEGGVRDYRVRIGRQARGVGVGMGSSLHKYNSEREKQALQRGIDEEVRQDAKQADVRDASQYTKTDKYTSTNNVVAGTPVSDRLIRSYMVAISSSSGSCSGTVIGSRWILTAAHCRVRVGAHALIGGTTNLNGVTYTVRRFIAHPQYKVSLDGNVEAHDIALVETDRLRHGGAVKVSMNEEGPDEGRFVRASGFGQIAEDWISGSERPLLQVDIPMVSFKSCVRAFARYGAGDFARALRGRSHICAGYDDDDCSGDTCYGDSGGPIVVRSGSEYVQVGIVSGGIGCARKGLPGVYTRVGQYWEWVRNVTGGDVEGLFVEGNDDGKDVDVEKVIEEVWHDNGNELIVVGVVAGSIGVGVVVLAVVGVMVRICLVGGFGGKRESRKEEKQNSSASLDELLRFEKGVVVDDAATTEREAEDAEQYVRATYTVT